MKSPTYLFFAVFIIFSCAGPKQQESQEKIRTLILDGSNNHYVWPKTTFMMKSYLEETGLFEVDIFRTDSVWLGRKYNPNRPEPYDGFIKSYPVKTSRQLASSEPLRQINTPKDFEKYDLIVSNLGSDTPRWPEEVEKRFISYMKNGGGLVIVHAANNAWGDWEAFNEMIGLGAWGERDSTSGPFVYIDNNGGVQKDLSAGICGSHGKEHEFIVRTQLHDHPIVKGLPNEWLHGQDELYDRMRGPFKNAQILATAFSDESRNRQTWEPFISGTGKHVPILLAINYGEGRIFHTTLGHFSYSMECVGFITTFQRGAEWASTGQVSQSVPSDFPDRTNVKTRSWVPE